MSAPIIVWLQQDLRLRDNPALAHAAEGGRPVIVLYILDDKTPGDWKMGGASRWWLHHSLESLDKSLHRHRVPLILKAGDPQAILSKLAKAAGASGVYWNRRYEPYYDTRDKTVAAHLRHAGFEVRVFRSALLFEPGSITTGSGSPFKVYTPFWKKCLQSAALDEPLPEPHLTAADATLESDALHDWKLLPRKPDWAGGLRKACKPGEASAQERWRAFLTHSLSAYAKNRDFPALPANSGLSPYIHFGEISVRQLWHDCHHAARGGHSAADKFLSELGWREFNHQLLTQFPALPEKPFHASFADFPWAKGGEDVRAWQRGQTGYPLVDAGMRELWTTGAMHNRVRMITASFLIKHLLQPWQTGERWFWDTLVDADLANNAGNWQWVAGCGADAAPYFRIFNPVAQGQRFDAGGDYIRRWVPELAKLPDNYLHAPWTCPKSILSDCGVTLGMHYPLPIVNHEEARERAMAAYRSIRS